jgi:DNA-binding HxlR family transcriptional regulator
MQNLGRLIPLFHRRWSVPLLAELERSGGAKFDSLAYSLGASPSAVRQTLDELISRGWVIPNPGYGHPLRPEYILTSGGHRLAPMCNRLDGMLRKLDLREVALRKWSMPALYVVGHGSRRFSEIGSALGSITDRALSLTLKDLYSAGVLIREVGATHPPVSLYQPTRTGQALIPILKDF